MVNKLWIFMALMALYQSAETLEFSFSGNFSSSNESFFLENAQNENSKIVLTTNNSTISQAYYIQSASSHPSFSTTFVFRLQPQTIMAFQTIGTTYNFPSCDLSSPAGNFYPCNGLAVQFDAYTDEVSIFLSRNDERYDGPLNNQSMSLRNQTLKVWIDYHKEPSPSGIRMWIAINGTDRPSNPLIDSNNITLSGSYFYPGFTAISETDANTTATVFSWSFSATTSAKRRSRNRLAWIPIISIAAVGAFCLGGWLLRGRLVQRSRVQEMKRKQAFLASHALASYTFRELESATNNFKEIIGRGGTCIVYKGVLQNGHEVAVKDLHQSAESQFFEELDIISRVKHHHLVSLLGWCQENGKLFLVYEFMSQGSLDKVLFTGNSSNPLSWDQRLEILVSLAEALTYLHEGLEKRIVHRDIKAANLLLDGQMIAKLGDFGLARLMHTAAGEQTMTRAGTLGYISPELAYTGKATEKSDVYSFGILVLEMVAGRRSIDRNNDEENIVLLERAWKMHQQNKLSLVVDSRMFLGHNELLNATNVMKLGLLCCSVDAKDRPTMRKCCQILTQDLELPPLPPHKPFNVILNVFEDDSSTAFRDSRSSSFLSAR